MARSQGGGRVAGRYRDITLLIDACDESGARATNTAKPHVNRRRAIQPAHPATASYDLGCYEVSFSATNHNGSRFVDTAVVTADGKLLF